jgi:hypothetical protein
MRGGPGPLWSDGVGSPESYRSDGPNDGGSIGLSRDGGSVGLCDDRGDDLVMGRTAWCSGHVVRVEARVAEIEVELSVDSEALPPLATDDPASERGN